MSVPTINKSDLNRAVLAASGVAGTVVSNGRYAAFPSLCRNGDLLVCVYRDHAYLHIGQLSRLMLRTSNNNGVTWGEAEVVWNPANGHSIVEGGITFLADGTYVIIAMTENLTPYPSNQSQEGQVYLIRGEPGSWQTPELLPATTTIYGGSSGTLLETENGTWLVPIFWDDAYIPGSASTQTGGVLRSTDQGTTWTRIQVTSTVIPNAGHECVLTLNSDDSIYLWIRSTPAGGNQGRSTSTDDGLTWSVPISCTPPGYSPSRPCIARIATGTYAGNLISIYRFPDGITSEGYIARSADEGVTWTNHELLRTGFFVYAAALPLGSGIECVIANHVGTNTFSNFAVSDIVYLTHVYA